MHFPCLCISGSSQIFSEGRLRTKIALGAAFLSLLVDAVCTLLSKGRLHESKVDAESCRCNRQNYAGGATSSEISALRFLSRHNAASGGGAQIVVGTTKLTNGQAMLNSLTGEFRLDFAVRSSCVVTSLCVYRGVRVFRSLCVCVYVCVCMCMCVCVCVWSNRRCGAD